MQFKEFQRREYYCIFNILVFLFEKTYIFGNFNAYSLKYTNTGVSQDIRFGEKEGFSQGIGFLTHRTFEYREEKVQTCMKMPHYIQRQAQFGLLVWLLFLRACYSYQKSRRVKTREGYGSDLEDKFIPFMCMEWLCSE